MSVRVQCPSCRSVCQLPPELLGKTVRCGHCGQPFVSPPPAQPEEEIGLELDGPAASSSLDARESAPPPNAVCRLELGCATSPGLTRAINEDSYLAIQFMAASRDQRRDVALIVVADGVGSEEAGDRASGLTVRTVGTALLGSLAAFLAVQDQDKIPEGLSEQVAAAMRSANRAVYEAARTTPGCQGMAATMAVVVLWEGQAFIGHAGDCRVYHRNGQGLKQVTKDQTVVARLVEMGKLTAAEAATHPSRHEVLQAVGKRTEIHPGIHELKAQPGEWLIVACDGLHAHLDASALAETLDEAGASAALAAERLVERANRVGGSDNCTVVAVRCY